MIHKINKEYGNIIKKETTIIEALKVMNSSSLNLLIVVNKDKLVSLISIGDIRRAILNNFDLNTTYIEEIMREDILIARETDSMDKIRKIMLKERIVCMPIVDEFYNLLDIHYWDELFLKEKSLQSIDAQVVIMAGGFGTRLKPITNIIPKPLIPVGERPIIEIIIDNFMKHKVSDFYISVNYKAQMIEDYLKIKESKSCNLTYFKEENPLGTIGSLYLIKNKLKNTIFVSNCDIIIEEDYAEIYKYHKNSKNDITIVSALKHIEIPYGVMETEKGGNLINMIEKPEYTFQINTGMYILEPHIIDMIPDNEFYHITDLIEKVNIEGKVGVFPIPEKSWYDIGQWKEYTSTLAKYSNMHLDI